MSFESQANAATLAPQKVEEGNNYAVINRPFGFTRGQIK